MITNVTKMITVMMIQNNDNYDNIDMHGDHNNDDDYWGEENWCGDHNNDDDYWGKFMWWS